MAKGGNSNKWTLLFYSSLFSIDTKKMMYELKNISET